MYLQHFGFTQQPFNLTPDTEFFCELPSHREALNVLLIALENGEGFIKITGPVGTGKTLLCRKLLKELLPPIITAYIPNPDMDAVALHQAIADELGIKYSDRTGQNRILAQINTYLLQAAEQGQKVVLLIDEAQAMPLKTLESLRLLTNLETEKQKLIHIVLFGQPELDDILKNKLVHPLLQRISFSYHLKPLNRQQTQDYLSHRLHIAGNTHTDVLNTHSIGILYFYSQGIPRLINILANKALLAAYGKGHSTLRWQHIHQAATDTDETRHRLVRWFYRKFCPWLLVVGVLTGFLLYAGYYESH